MGLFKEIKIGFINIYISVSGRKSVENVFPYINNKRLTKRRRMYNQVNPSKIHI